MLFRTSALYSIKIDLFMDNWSGKNFIKCLEEDLDDQSALYNVVWILNQNLKL
jgi:hypothetical protein